MIHPDLFVEARAALDVLCEYVGSDSQRAKRAIDAIDAIERAAHEDKPLAPLTVRGDSVVVQQVIAQAQARISEMEGQLTRQSAIITEQLKEIARLCRQSVSEPEAAMTLAERVECLEEQCEAHRRAISTLREERPGRRVLAAFYARAKAEREDPVAVILDELDLA